MRQFMFLLAAMRLTPIAQAQVISFCTDEDCGNCPGGLTTAGAGVKDDCVIYDTETVFGGQGFEKGEGRFLYNAFAKFSEPCGGAPGALMIRSPAVLAEAYCGDLVRYKTDEGCGSAEVNLEETFMVQFCCGSNDCTAAGVPFGRRSLGHREPGGASGGLYLSYPNGTVIEPLAVGKASPRSEPNKRDCVGSVDGSPGFEEGSYVPDGDWYVATFETQKVSNDLPAQTEDRPVTVTYDQTVETSTHFDLSIGDPFGVVSASAGIEFSSSHTNGLQYGFTLPANQSGYLGFTPAYQCTKGTIQKCGGEVQPEGESCTPFIVNGMVQGDYLMVEGE